jgi:tetratricopeptide (TPR) repeat protein
MTRASSALAVLVLANAAAAQTPAPSPSPQAQAYYEFLMARKLESSGDATGALAALERARKLDPTAAELAAEMAGLYARQGRGREAVAAAEQALKLDAENVEAHRILAQIYSGWSEGAPQAPPGQSLDAMRDTAIEHLVALQRSPLMATDPNLQLTLGRLYLSAGRPKEAVPVLERVAAQVPWAAEPLALLAEARVAVGRLEEAAEALQAAAEINPRFAVTLGDLYERQGRWADAAEAFEEAVSRMRSPSRDLRLRWATALVNIPGGRGAAKALAILKDLAAVMPDDPRVLYLLSNAQRASGDGTAAEATARRMIDRDPKDLRGLQALASALFDRYQYRAMVDALASFSRDPVSRSKGREAEGASVLIQLGLAHQQLGEFDAAIAAFTAAEKLQPRDPDLDVYLVQAHLAARRFSRADELAREALARLPGQPRLVRLRAQALFKAGSAAAANKLLEDGVAAYPDNRDYLVGLADLYAAQKRVDEAVGLLQRARKLAGDDDETITMRLAGAYEAGGRLAEAEREYRTLLARDPLNASAMNSLGYLLADHGLRLPEALEFAERAVQAEPDNPAYLDTLGWALFRAGRVNEALPPLGRAADTLAGSSVIQDHHGDALARAGRTAEAVAAWERALAGDGEQIDRAAVEKKIKDARARRR